MSGEQMTHATLASILTLILLVASGPPGTAQSFRPGDAYQTKMLSFRSDVMPLMQRHCLPCHADGSSNPSELFLDSHALLMAGGKNGAAVVPGNPDKSSLYTKLLSPAPFGDRMPLRKKRDLVPNTMTDEEISTIRNWISQGAKNN
jgi:hypothetical protein